MTNHKNSLNLKPKKNNNNNTLTKSISSRPQVDSLIRKEKRIIKTQNISEQKSEQKDIQTKKEKIVKASIVENNEIESNVKDSASIDDSKRLFLKVAGIAGLGLAASALFPKSSEAYVSGSTPTSNVVGLKDSSNARINPAKEDGNLATIAGKDFATQTTLAGIKTQSDKLTFDGSNNLLTSSAISSSGATSIGLSVNDQSLWMLRKILTLLKPLGMTTGGQSNRLNIDVNAITTLPTLATVTTVGTLTNLAYIGNVNSFSLMKDSAKNAYANSMRSQISF